MDATISTESKMQEGGFRIGAALLSLLLAAMGLWALVVVFQSVGVVPPGREGMDLSLENKAGQGLLSWEVDGVEREGDVRCRVNGQEVYRARSLFEIGGDGGSEFLGGKYFVPAFFAAKGKVHLYVPEGKRAEVGEVRISVPMEPPAWLLMVASAVLAGSICGLLAMGWLFVPSFLPGLAIRQGVIIALVVLAVLLVLEYLILPGVEMRGEINTRNWKIYNHHIWTNSVERNLGTQTDWIFRTKGHPVSPQKEEGRKRILVMGDSFVWGDGYANINQIWWRQLQLVLRERGYENVEVIAAGQCGTSTRMQLFYIGKFVEEVQPDLVVWGVVSNDADEGIVPVFYPQLWKDDSIVRLHERMMVWGIFPRINFQLQSLRIAKLAASRPYEAIGFPANVYSSDRESPWEAAQLSPENLHAYRQTVSDTADYVRSISVPCAFVALPDNPFMGPFFEKHYETMGSLFHEQGLTFYNLWEPYHEKVESYLDVPRLWWGNNPSNGHPCYASTRAYAGLVADLLERDYPEMLGERVDPVQSAAGAGLPLINDWLPAGLDPVPSESDPWTVTFEYPVEGLIPSMPIGAPHVQLHFREPVAVGQVQVSWKLARNATLYYAIQDPENPFAPIRKAQGAVKGAFFINEPHVASLYLHLEPSGETRPVTLSVKPLEQP